MSEVRMQGSVPTWVKLIGSAAVAIGLLVAPAAAANAAVLSVSARSCSNPNWAFISSTTSGATTHLHQAAVTGVTTTRSFVDAGGMFYRESYAYRSIIHGTASASSTYAADSFCRAA